MTTEGTVADHVAHLEQQVARLEGELVATLSRLASLEASDEQHRLELEAAHGQLAAAETDLEHSQRHARDLRDADQRHIASLEARLADAEGVRRTAERERAAVIAALGRGARRRLEEAEPESGSSL